MEKILITIEYEVSEPLLKVMYEALDLNSLAKKSKSVGFIFQNKLIVFTGATSSGEKGLIEVRGHEVVPFKQYHGNPPAVTNEQHYLEVMAGKRERGYLGQIVYVEGQKMVFTGPQLNFKKRETIEKQLQFF